MAQRVDFQRIGGGAYVGASCIKIIDVSEFSELNSTVGVGADLQGDFLAIYCRACGLVETLG